MAVRSPLLRSPRAMRIRSAAMAAPAATFTAGR